MLHQMVFLLVLNYSPMGGWLPRLPPTMNASTAATPDRLIRQARFHEYVLPGVAIRIQLCNMYLYGNPHFGNSDAVVDYIYIYTYYGSHLSLQSFEHALHTRADKDVYSNAHAYT